MNTKKAKSTAVPSLPAHPDFQPPANVMVLCKECQNALKFFGYLGQGHDRKAVWYCDHKGCKKFHEFIY